MLIPSFEIVRSRKRKTLSLQVKAGQVRVLAPLGISKEYIETLVTQKSAWLQQKINQQQRYLKQQTQQNQLHAGDDVLYLGKTYTLTIVNAPKQDVYIQGPNLIVCYPHPIEPLCQDTIKKLLQNWYISNATNLLPSRLTHLQQHTGLQATALKIRHYKTRWGSCDAKHRINLNWLLILTPLSVIDYVITHELCHTVHLNHSNDYWQLVHLHCPNFQQEKQWLKSNQHKLHWSPSNI